MNWSSLALLAAGLNGAVSVVDKFIVAKRIPDAIVYSLFMSVFGLASAVVMPLIVDIHTTPLMATLLALFSGTVYLAYIVLYFAAMGFGDAPVVVALAQITPIFSALWGFFCLGERLGPLTYVGVAIVIAGAILISLERSEDQGARAKLQLNTALPLMVAGCFVNSVSQLMLKYALQETSDWDGFFWPRLGVFAGALAMLLVPSHRRRLRSSLREIGPGTYSLILGNEGLALFAVFLLTLAYDRGLLTLVSASSAVQPLFIIALVWVVNRVKPGLVPDRTDRRVLAVRLLPLGMIILGVYLLSR